RKEERARGLLPLFRAVLVWVVVLVSIVLPRLEPPQQESVSVAVTRLTAYDRTSAVQQARAQKVQAAQMAHVQSWSVDITPALALRAARQRLRGGLAVLALRTRPLGVPGVDV